MKKILFSLFVLVVAVQTSEATYIRQRIVVAPLAVQQVYTAPLAVTACGSATSAQVTVAPLVNNVAVETNTPSVVQSVTTPAVVQTYSQRLAVVNNHSYGSVAAFSVPVVRQRAFAFHSGSVLRVNTPTVIRTRVGGVFSSIGRFFFGRRVQAVVAPAAIRVNAPGVSVRVR